MAKSRNTTKSDPLSERVSGPPNDIADAASVRSSSATTEQTARQSVEVKVLSTRLTIEMHDRLARAATWTTPRTTIRDIVERAIMRELEKMEREYERLTGRKWPEG